MNIFGIPAERKSAKIVLTPVAWEVTTSYGSGTSRGPDAILEASPQIDLFDIECGEAYKSGYFLEKADPFFKKHNSLLKSVAQKVIRGCNEFGVPAKKDKALLAKVNSGSEKMVQKVYDKTIAVLKENKIPAVLGGDHSTPLGAIKALSEKYNGEMGVLHIDAHADLRLAYQGFTHSHASIMRNVCLLKTPPKRLIQVGIRDFCKEEYDYIQENPNRLTTYFDQQLKSRSFAGESWKKICEEIVSQLPQNVYVSFDIDGLSPEFCPNTGTPVPGGLSFDQATQLLATLGHSGKRIVGFDLNEVAPGKDSEWDGNVGSRILFKLCGWAAVTNGFAKPNKI